MFIEEKRGSGSSDLSSIPVREMTMKETMSVKGLDCADCALTLERGVAGMSGVGQAEVNFTLARMVLAYDPQRISREAIVRQVRELGYDVEEQAASAEAAEKRGLR